MTAPARSLDWHRCGSRMISYRLNDLSGLRAKPFHGKHLLSLAGTARKRDNKYLTVPGRSVRGANGPIQNFSGDVAQQQPAILFSLHRTVLGKGRDGDDLRRHDLELRPLPVTSSVTGSEFVIRQRSLLSAQLLAEARAWAEELTDLEIGGDDDLEDAWHRLERRYGIPTATFFSLRYRKDLKDIWASIHMMLRLAVEAERGRRARKLTLKSQTEAIVTGRR